MSRNTVDARTPPGPETDAEIYARVCREPGAARVVQRVAVHLRDGDSYTRRLAERDLSEWTTRAEAAAIKRYLKATGQTGDQS